MPQFKVKCTETSDGQQTSTSYTLLLVNLLVL